MSTVVDPLVARTEPVRGERRTLLVPAEFDVRDAGDGTVGIRGYAAVFDQVAYGEVVRKGCFDKTLAERDDVRFLVNHDGVPFARTKSGTLALSLDDRGLIAEAPDVDVTNPTVTELVSAMRRGDIDQMSFAFTPIRWGQYTDETTDRVVWEILECRLWDVSVVTYPWYDETTVELNELDRALADLHAGRALTPQRRALVMDAVSRTAGDDQPADEPAPGGTPAATRSLEELELLGLV